VKILFFIDSLQFGGKERRLIELLKTFKSITDFEIQLVVMNNEVHYNEIFKMDIKINFLSRKRKKDLAIFFELYNICRTFNPDIIHCWDSMTAIYSVPICKILNIKLVNGMVTDTLVKRGIFIKPYFRAKLTFLFSDIIAGNSKAGLKSYRAPLHKSVCIYNGIDLKRFINLKEPSILRKQFFGDLSDNVFIAGMVAVFEPRKDYKTLIESAINILNSNFNIRFILIGSGSTLNEIKDMIPEPYYNKIIFLGNRNDVESIVNVFDLGILCTNSDYHGEGISNSILEYMALGKPVVATYGGGTNEVVKDGYNGYLVDSGSVKQLTDKIQEFLNNRQLAKEFGMNGRKIVLQKFNSSKMSQEYYRLFEELIKK